MPNPCRNALPTTATAYSESQGRSTPGWSTPAPTPVRCCEALRPAYRGAERPRETRSLGRGVSWAVRRRGTPARAYRRPTLPLRARSLRQGCPVFLSCVGSVVPFRRPPQSRAAASRARSIPIWVVHARAQAGQNRVRQERRMLPPGGESSGALPASGQAAGVLHPPPVRRPMPPRSRGGRKDPPVLSRRAQSWSPSPATAAGQQRSHRTLRRWPGWRPESAPAGGTPGICWGSGRRPPACLPGAKGECAAWVSRCGRPAPRGERLRAPWRAWATLRV